MIRHEGYAVWFEKKDGRWEGHLEGKGLSVSGAPGVLILALKNVPLEELEKELPLESAKEIISKAAEDKREFKSFLYWLMGKNFFENTVYDLADQIKEEIKEKGYSEIPFEDLQFDYFKTFPNEEVLKKAVENSYDSPFTDFDLLVEKLYGNYDEKLSGVNKVKTYRELKEYLTDLYPTVYHDVVAAVGEGVERGIWRALADEYPLTAAVYDAEGTLSLTKVVLNSLLERKFLMDSLGEALTPASKNLGMIPGTTPERRVVGDYDWNSHTLSLTYRLKGKDVVKVQREYSGDFLEDVEEAVKEFKDKVPDEEVKALCEKTMKELSSLNLENGRGMTL